MDKNFDKSKLVEFFGRGDRICKERSDGIVSRANVTLFHFPAQEQYGDRPKGENNKKDEQSSRPFVVSTTRGGRHRWSR